MSEFRQIMDHLQELSNRITALENSSNNIKPSVGVKVAYDNKGHVTGVLELTSSDIPMLPIEHIIGLETLLNDAIGKNELKKIDSRLNKVENHKLIKSGTGTRINYDATGRVTSSTDLVPNDIPTLPISKILGLSDKLKMIDEYFTNFQTIETTVVDNSKNILDDLKFYVDTKINEILGQLSNYTTIKQFDSLYNHLYSNTNKLPSGEYNTIHINSNGDIHKVSNVDYIPKISIDDISGLYQQLSDKIGRDEFVLLYNSITALLSSNIHNRVIDIESNIRTLNNLITNISTIDNTNNISTIDNVIIDINKKLKDINKKILLLEEEK